MSNIIKYLVHEITHFSLSLSVRASLRLSPPGPKREPIVIIGAAAMMMEKKSAPDLHHANDGLLLPEGVRREDAGVRNADGTRGKRETLASCAARRADAKRKACELYYNTEQGQTEKRKKKEKKEKAEQARIASIGTAVSSALVPILSQLGSLGFFGSPIRPRAGVSKFSRPTRQLRSEEAKLHSEETEGPRSQLARLTAHLDLFRELMDAHTSRTVELSEEKAKASGGDPSRLGILQRQIDHLETRLLANVNEEL